MDEAVIQVEKGATGFVITTLTGTFDQAALIGLLRKLYYMGYPLISVNCIQPNDKHKKEDQI
ncbi:MAG: hypothetical protein MUO62_02710 [Anaerolineales bacterium]|nr:hypothetical protein [Anaerolineales bacterium]